MGPLAPDRRYDEAEFEGQRIPARYLEGVPRSVRRRTRKEKERAREGKRMQDEEEGKGGGLGYPVRAGARVICVDGKGVEGRTGRVVKVFQGGDGERWCLVDGLGRVSACFLLFSSCKATMPGSQEHLHAISVLLKPQRPTK